MGLAACARSSPAWCLHGADKCVIWVCCMGCAAWGVIHAGSAICLRQTDRQTDRQRERQRDRQTGRQAGRQAATWFDLVNMQSSITHELFVRGLLMVRIGGMHPSLACVDVKWAATPYKGRRAEVCACLRTLGAPQKDCH